MAETIFILGREPALSVAELTGAFSGQGKVVWCSNEAAFVESVAAVPATMLRRLGGSVKQVEIVEQVSGMTASRLDWLSSGLVLKVLGPDGRDIGASVYGATAAIRAQVQRRLLSIKKQTAEIDRPIRIVTSREPHLSAVTVQRQGLLRRGAELVLLVHGETWLIGKTVAVQDYQAYGLRDFGRPAADAKSGMLPPKVAQMMLNIARVQPDDILLDPFCGSGTVLQEAVLLGVRRVIGSDISNVAVKDSQENIRWLLREYPELHSDIEITLQDARAVTARPTVVVTEPYLGKPLHGNETVHTLEDRAKELRALYLAAMRQWYAILPTGGRVVMVWPQMGDGAVQIQLDQEVTALGFRSQPLLDQESAQALKVEHERSILYGRPDAKVKREIRYWVK
jgi:tRNA (guanine10-N2)-dimethyltransferase